MATYPSFSHQAYYTILVLFKQFYCNILAMDRYAKWKRGILLKKINFFYKKEHIRFSTFPGLLMRRLHSGPRILKLEVPKSNASLLSVKNVSSPSQYLSMTMHLVIILIVKALHLVIILIVRVLLHLVVVLIVKVLP